MEVTCAARLKFQKLQELKTHHENVAPTLIVTSHLQALFDFRAKLQWQFLLLGLLKV